MCGTRTVLRRLQNRMVSPQRGLYIEHIEACAGKTILIQRFHKGQLINGRPPRRIYQDRRTFHFG